MAIRTIQLMASNRRNQISNYQLGALLAFVAGAVNAGGFLAINRYTSHMTGVISIIADELALVNFHEVIIGITMLTSFLLGSATTTILVNWGHRHQIHSQYALPIFFEALVLMLFGFAGSMISHYQPLTTSVIVFLLSFLMGLQNAIITKISKAEIRTTHMTGVLTDIGIEIGHLAYWNRSELGNKRQMIKANHQKLRAHLLIVSMFLIGGVIGALSFKLFGYGAIAPVAIALISVSLTQIIRDIKKIKFQFN